MLDGRVVGNRASHTMTINIELGPEEERALAQRARMSGRDLTEYVHQILQHYVSPALEEAHTAADSMARVVIDERSKIISTTPSCSSPS
jgi:uncharacterized protein (DUF1778 family)